MPGPAQGLGAVALLVALVVVLVFGEGSGDESGGDAGGQALSVPVTRVVDGDTIEVEIDGVVDDVRLIGVDTPETVKPGEPVECFGPQASEFTHELLEGEDVRLAFDRERRDVYDRLLAYVHLDETFVNAELLQRGLARTLAIEPNTRYEERFARLESRAGAAGRGLWGAC